MRDALLALVLWSVVSGAPAARAVDLDAGDLLQVAGRDIAHIDGVTGARTVLASQTSGFLGLVLRGAEIYASGVTSNTGAVWRINPATGQITLVSSGGLLGNVAPDIDLEASGDLVVTAFASFDVPGVVRVDPVTGAQQAASNLNMNGFGVAIGADGDLYMSRRSVFPNQILRIRPDTTIAWQRSSEPYLVGDVLDVEVGPNGDVFVNGGDGGRYVARFDPVTAAGSLTAIAFDSIVKFHADLDGSLLVAGTLAGVEGLYRADPSTGAAVLISTVRGGDVVVIRPCADRFDNDGDGDVDYPADADCDDALDPDEGPACGDGVDNDHDGLLDFPADPGCASANDASERAPGLTCDDGIDNDGDTSSDYPQDLGCASVSDAAETSPARVCDNGFDDDFDGAIDVAADPGCGTAAGPLENPRCQNGVDDDRDGQIDYDGGAFLNGGVPIAPPDAACTSPSRSKETSGCGIGFELVALAPLLRALQRRARRTFAV